MKEIVDPFTGRELGKAMAAATTIVRIDRSSAGHPAADVGETRHASARPLVPLAWTRLPDARASIPVGPCMPMIAKRYFEARHGHHVRVRCRLPDIDDQPCGQPIVE
jgi:hypothetical protein